MAAVGAAVAKNYNITQQNVNLQTQSVVDLDIVNL